MTSIRPTYERSWIETLFWTRVFRARTWTWQKDMSWITRSAVNDKRHIHRTVATLNYNAAKLTMWTVKVKKCAQNSVLLIINAVLGFNVFKKWKGHLGDVLSSHKKEGVYPPHDPRPWVDLFTFDDVTVQVIKRGTGRECLLSNMQQLLTIHVSDYETLLWIMLKVLLQYIDKSIFRRNGSWTVRHCHSEYVISQRIPKNKNDLLTEVN